MEQGLRFKAMYASLGLTVDDVANFLQVTPRTVQLWISGRVRVPYAAYKLMRLQLRYELPGAAWEGWHLSAGRLYTPEGYEIDPGEFSWWSLLVRQARCFRSLYVQNQALRTESRHREALAPHEGRDAVRRAPGRRLSGACDVKSRRVPPGNHGENRW